MLKLPSASGSQQEKQLYRVHCMLICGSRSLTFSTFDRRGCVLLEDAFLGNFPWDCAMPREGVGTENPNVLLIKKLVLRG